MPDVVLRQGRTGQYLCVEYDPHPPRPGTRDLIDPELLRWELPAGSCLSAERRLWAHGVRPTVLKPSLAHHPRHEPEIFTESGNYKAGYRASKEAQEAARAHSFTPIGRAIIGTKHK